MSKGQVQYEIGVELFTRVEKLEAGLKKAQSVVNAEMEKLAQTAAKKAADAAERATRAAQNKVKKEMDEFNRLYEAAMERRKQEESQRVQEGVQREVEERTMPGRDGYEKRGRTAGKNFGVGFQGGLSKVVRGVMAASIADSILEGIIKGIKDKETSIVHSIGNELSRILRAIPVAGAIGELAAMAFDNAGYMGGAMGMESRQQSSREEAAKNQDAAVRAARRKAKQEQGIYERNQMIANTSAELKRREIGRSMGDYDDLFGEAREEVGSMKMDSPEKIEAAATKLSAAAKRALDENLLLVEELRALEVERVNSRKDLGDLEKHLQIQLLNDSFRTQKHDLRELHADRMKMVEEIQEAETKALEERLEKEKEALEKIAKSNRKKMREGREGLEAMMESAQGRAASQTATFSTAGGSFTTAVNAQVDHLKVMREAIQKFPQLLTTIAGHTAALRGIGFV